MKQIFTNRSVFQWSLMLSFLVASLCTLAQPSIEWQRALGGSKADNAYSSIQTLDGGYLTIGEARSNDGDVTGHHGVTTDTVDVWLVKTDAMGVIQWQKSYGGTMWDYSSSVIQTNDGGYAFVASTFSRNGDITLNHGSGDAWLVKLDVSGNIQWQKTYGGTGMDQARSFKQTSDNGYVILSISTSTNGDVSGNHGQSDLWVLKVDNAGTPQWQRCLGGSSVDGNPSVSLIGFNQAQMEVIQT